MKRIIALMLALLMVGAVLAACGTKNTTETTADDKATADSVETVDDIAAVTANGKLVVGITDFEPMDYKADGEWVGFDAELAAGFAEALGVSVEFVEIDWDNKIMELNGGTVDCIWNGMTLTPEVTSAMSCSDSYLQNAQVVVVNKDVADKYADVESCKDLLFAVENGSAGMEEAQANDFKIVNVKDQATALMEVASGTCDAAVIDLLMAKAMVGEGTGYEQLAYTVSLNSEEYGVGFRTGSNLTEKCNEYLAAAKTNGAIDKLTEKYLVKG